MGQIEVIAASAGTGKTHRLATLLESEVVAGRVRPDAIVATTFTNKAAAELEERVRGRLLRAGRVEAARLLGASRIGTVHAVCTRLVMDFAFELGLSPSLRVLDEELAYHALKEALSRVVDRSTLDELQGLASRMPRFKPQERGGQRLGGWQRAIDTLVDHARSNRISAEQLHDAAAPAWDGFARLLDPPDPAPAALERRLAEVTAAFVDWAEANDPTRTTRNAVDRVRPIADRLRAGLPITWHDWASLAALPHAAKASEPLAEEVRRAALAFTRHPQLHHDARRAIELVHQTAARALQAYEEHKRTWGVVDFRDQEVLALDLLGRADVRARLEDELDLVLVDEFQDTSPIQLAIFLRLADLARRSVWVGDQKQAIFGFRGTDPALLDAVLDGLAARQTPETLSVSWRSRPALVTLTSRLFEQAFAEHGLPPERVRLEPARSEEPTGLGPVLERWTLLAYKRRDQPAALAACVGELLADPSTRVRDLQSGEATRARARDVAILCRTNRSCAQVAGALEALGIRAVRARGGLFATAEGVVGLAALQALADGSDALAVAKLARFLTEPDAGDGNGWLDRALSDPYARAFEGLPEVQRLRAAREALATAGAVPALEAALEAVGLADLCLRWGDAEQRLANIDRLRALAVDYADHCATTGAGCTPAGLAAHFQALAKQGTDAQAQPTAVDAVQISTWHAAKGLEWPIVVLYDLHETTWEDVLDAQLVSRRAGFDLSDPLGGRWARFWPDPFAWWPRQRPRGKLSFFERLAADPTALTARDQSERQLLRLLYVGWTRARDRLVLAARDRELTTGILGYLSGPQGPLLDEPGENATWVPGLPIAVQLRSSAGHERIPRPSQPGAGYDAPGPAEHPPAVLSPSDLQQWGPVDRPIVLGPALAVRGQPEMNRLGEAVHGFLAADRTDLSAAAREALAEGLLARFAVTGALAPADLLEASRRLAAFLAERWPGARLRREWPLRHRLGDGTLVVGQPDLVVESAGELAVIDHKTLSGGLRRAVQEAAGYAGQVATYAHALTAALGLPVRGCFLHLPLSGVVVALEPKQLELAV